MERLRAQVQAQGWQLWEEHIFRDDGYSGANLNRPGLDRLRDQAAQRELDRGLLTAPDRLARNYIHQMLLIEELEQHGCQAEFLDRPMSRDPHDQLLLQIRGAVAEYERTLIAERMRRGWQTKFRAGLLLPWTRPPHGYRVNPDRLRDPTGVRVDEAEAATVTEMFADYLEKGHTLHSLNHHLMAIQAPTPNGHQRGNQATVHGILTNPVYTGKLYVGRTRPTPARGRRSPLKPVGRPMGGYVKTPPEEWILVTTLPTIVTQEQFDLVQAKLSHNQQYARRNNLFRLGNSTNGCGAICATC